MWCSYIKKILKAVLIMAIGLVLSACILFFGFIEWVTYDGNIEDEKGLRSKKFSRVEWLDSYSRSEMYYDLIENHIHIGMSWQAMQNMLGSTIWRIKYNEKDYKRLCYRYDLGVLLRGIHHSSFSLTICPDQSMEKVDKIVLIGGKYKDFANGVRLVADDEGNLYDPKEFFTGK